MWHFKFKFIEIDSILEMNHLNTKRIAFVKHMFLFYSLFLCGSNEEFESLVFSKIAYFAHSSHCSFIARNSLLKDENEFKRVGIKNYLRRHYIGSRFDGDAIRFHHNHTHTILNMLELYIDTSLTLVCLLQLCTTYEQDFT